MSEVLAMSKDDLEQAYRAHDPSRAGHQAGEAVVVGPEGITVLATANPTGDAAQTWVLRLSLDGAVTWERHYDPKYGDPRAIARVAHGGFVIAGEVQRSATEYQASLLHIDGAGEIVGAAAVGPRGVTGFNTVQARADGTIVAGGSAGWKGWLVTTDSQLRHPGERAVAVDEVQRIQLLSSGEVAVLGITERSTTGFGRAGLLSVAPAGEVRWQVSLPTRGRGDPAALVVGQDGVLVVGSGASQDGALAHVWLARVDAAGRVTWERTLDAAPANARGWAATALPDGYAIAGETATIEGMRTPHVWRVGDDGTPRWYHSYRGPDGPARADARDAFEILNGLEAMSDGGLVLVGSTTRGVGKTNVWVIRLAPDGAVLWQRVFGAAAKSS